MSELSTTSELSSEVEFKSLREPEIAGRERNSHRQTRSLSKYGRNHNIFAQVWLISACRGEHGILIFAHMHFLLDKMRSLNANLSHELDLSLTR